MFKRTDQFAFTELEALVIQNSQLLDMKWSISNNNCCCCKVSTKGVVILSFKLPQRDPQQKVYTRVHTEIGYNRDSFTALNIASEKLLPIAERYVELHGKPVVEAKVLLLNQT